MNRGLASRRAFAAAFVGLVILLKGTGTAWGQSTDLPKKLVAFVETELVQYSTDPDIVQAVAAQNARGVELHRIKTIDEQWKNTKLIDGFMFQLMRNACSHALLNIQIRYPFIVEAFVMDNQGALVGLTNKTSDYWQGDEAKFIESYKAGKGAIHYGELAYDDSVGETVMQVSLPVMKNAQAIGAITFGVSVDRWEYRRVGGRE